MMSLQEVSLVSVSLKQYFYKLKANLGLVNALIILQIITLFISFGGVSGMASSDGALSFSVKYYSANIAIGVTFAWIFFVAISLTTKQYKNLDFTFVTNRASSNLSNIGFLLSACIFGGVASGLFGALLRVVMYFAFDRSQIVMEGFYPAYADLLLGMAVAILYMFLIAAIGYFVGVLTQINIILAMIIPAVFFVLGLFQTIFGFFTSKISLPLFAAQISIISIVLFGCSILLSNRMEVRK